MFHTLATHTPETSSEMPRRDNVRNGLRLRHRRGYDYKLRNIVPKGAVRKPRKAFPLTARNRRASSWSQDPLPKLLESLTVIDHRFAASDGSERRAQLTSAR